MCLRVKKKWRVIPNLFEVIQPIVAVEMLNMLLSDPKFDCMDIELLYDRILSILPLTSIIFLSLIELFHVIHKVNFIYF